MIKLTRLDGDPFILNAELIQYVEARPDTFVTLLGGERIVVRETPEAVMDRAVRYQQSKYLIPPSHERWTTQNDERRTMNAEPSASQSE